MTESDALAEPLSNRELEILALLAENQSNKDIAACLNLSLNSIKWYARQIYAKLGVDNRRAAVEQAGQLGLLPGSAAPALEERGGPPLPSGPQLPSGTVTFLFTDIEGSTPRWEQQPAAMQAAVAQHHALLRQAIESSGGIVTQVVGDAFQAAFALAAQAVTAAVAAQRALLAADWPAETGPLAVRMGIHTGPAQPDTHGDAPYAVSHTLNRAARVMDAGAGGQILLSQEAADLARRELPPGSALMDLGEHRLRGLSLPERLFQLDVPGLARSFPPLRAGAVHPNNLPAQLTSFIDREQELRAVCGLLAQGRMVTLTGSGGTGKTRLALKAAEQVLPDYLDGAWFCELGGLFDPASPGDPELVPRAIAETLGLGENLRRSWLLGLQDYLREKQLLLVLDNCEHLIGDCARVAEALLRACPKLKILATSRESLGFPGEAAFYVPSLDVPDPHHLPDLAVLAQYTAVRLFAERSAAAGFRLSNENAGAVAQICARLDGIPLAIELAAARVGLLRVEQIADRLDDCFHLLTGGSRTALPRQQTLRASIEWSFNLLTAEERILLLRLSVFSGSLSLAAAEQVCADPVRQEDGGGAQVQLEQEQILDLLAQLVAKSLLQADAGATGEVRYRMLGTIRQYARDRLAETGDAHVLRDRHLSYYLLLAQEAEPHLRGKDQVYWLDLLDMELDNLRAALEWALRDEVYLGLQLAAALSMFWHIRAHRLEGERWLRQLQEQFLREGGGPAEGIALLVKAQLRRAFLLQMAGQLNPGTTQLAEEAAAQAEALGPAGKALQMEAAKVLAHDAVMNGQKEASYQLCLRALRLAQELDDRFMLAEIILTLSAVEPDEARSREYAEQNLALHQELGDLDGVMTAHLELAFQKYLAADLQGCYQHLEQSRQLAEIVKNRWGLVNTLVSLGQVLCESGAVERGIACFGQVLAITQELGEYAWIVRANHLLAHGWDLLGDWDQAQEYFGQGIRCARERSLPEWEVAGLFNLAESAWRRGDFALAEANFKAAAARQREAGASFSPALVQYGLAKLAYLHGDRAEAARQLRDALQASLRNGVSDDDRSLLETVAVHYATLPGQAARTARLHGAVRTNPGLYYQWFRMVFVLPLDLQNLLAPARDALGAEAYARLFAEGRTLGLEQAVVLALEGLDNLG